MYNLKGKEKEKDVDVVITRGDGEDNQSSSSSFQRLWIHSADGKTKSFHPPIETHFQLASPDGKKASTSLKSLLTYPLTKLRRSKSMQMALEGAQDPKDTQIVESFRRMLFLEGLLPPKHNDYHTLLRYLSLYVPCGSKASLWSWFSNCIAFDVCKVSAHEGF